MNLPPLLHPFTPTRLSFAAIGLPRRHFHSGLFALTIVIVLFGAAPVGAQVDSAVDPGVILREQERDDRRELLREVPVSIEAEQPAPPEGARDLRFILNQLEIEGATTIPIARLRPLWSQLLGREVSLATLYEIANKIGAFYRNDGYVLTVGLVPIQEIAEGHARIRIVEGFVDRVRIHGRFPEVRGLIQAHARRIEKSRPLRAAVLERALLLINDLPGVYARAVLVPSPETSGASILDLEIMQDPISAFAQVNNSGSRFSGPIRFDAGITANGVLGLHESTGFRTTHTPNNELHLYQLSHQQTLTSHGTRLDLTGTYVETDSGASLAILNVEGDSLAVSLGMTHPFVRSRARNLSGFVRLDYLDTDSEVGGSSSAEDHVRAIRVGGDFDIVDAWRGISRVNASVSQGLPILDSSKKGDTDNSRPDASSKHTKIEVGFSRLQGLPGRVNLLVEFLGQVALSDLLVSEEFSFGGRRIGRAYEVGEISGDHGVAVLAEFQYGFALPTPWLESAQLYTSYDIGRVWNRESGLPGGKSDQASSWAAGLRLNWTTWLALEGQIAIPLTRDAEVRGKGRDPRGFFSVSARWPTN